MLPPTRIQLSLPKQQKHKNQSVGVPGFEVEKEKEAKNVSTAASQQSLVIPALENSWKGACGVNTSSSGEKKLKITNESLSAANVSSNLKQEDLEAAEALQHEALTSNEDTSSTVNKMVLPSTGNRLINSNIEDSDRVKFENDVSRLPAALALDSDVYKTVPIADFGAAMLRGMGWNDKSDNMKDTDDSTMPRPHRLGLGATPKLELPEKKRPISQDQFHKRQKLQQQQDSYIKQRQKQIAADRQRTLQNGSLVQLGSKRRARIVQLVGVPGLNQVKVRVEGSSDDTVVPRREIGDLLSRTELEGKPFMEAADEKPCKLDRHREEGKGKKYEEDRKKKKKKDRKNNPKPSKPSPLFPPRSWIIPSIRVRVISTKLGKEFFKEKGVVVDVTPAGATIQLNSGQLLDRVPEKYLETALPKVGGAVVVLNGVSDEYHHAKGQLLDRKDGQGVVQMYSDKCAMRLALDDMAEWCGPSGEDDY